MKPAIAALALSFVVAAVPAKVYHVDLTRYFPSAAEEAQKRTQLTVEVTAFIASTTPVTPTAMRQWLARYDDLLRRLMRHDDYLYLKSEENDDDTGDAKSDDAVGALDDRLNDRLVRAARELGAARVTALTGTPELSVYRYLLEDALAQAAHQLSAPQRRAVELAVTPVLDAAAASYKALRRSSDSVAAHQDAFASLLVSIATARNGVARLRGFDGAAEAAYFDRSIQVQSVERILAALRTSKTYARYQSVVAKAPAPQFSPSPLPIGDAIPAILAAEQPMGPEYANAYAALLDPRKGRLEICVERQCDDAGFSLGFSGIDSAVYYGGYDGSLNAARAVAHESGHAVHRQFMNLNQSIAAYNLGPHYMFESFAILNELLFLDHLYRTAADDRQRAYYLNDFLKDATFQVYGSAEETELEAAIYRGVDDRTLRSAADFNALTVRIFAQYDPASVQDPNTALYWARDRLFFTDPLYDVNYLYAGLLALRYFTELQRSPATFPQRYVALLKNGFTDSPAALERRFLGIDLDDDAALVANAAELIDARTEVLSQLYSEGA